MRRQDALAVDSRAARMTSCSRRGRDSTDRRTTTWLVASDWAAASIKATAATATAIAAATVTVTAAATVTVTAAATATATAAVTAVASAVTATATAATAVASAVIATVIVVNVSSMTERLRKTKVLPARTRAPTGELTVARRRKTTATVGNAEAALVIVTPIAASARSARNDEVSAIMWIVRLANRAKSSVRRALTRAVVGLETESSCRSATRAMTIVRRVRSATVTGVRCATERALHSHRRTMVTPPAVASARSCS